MFERGSAAPQGGAAHSDRGFVLELIPTKGTKGMKKLTQKEKSNG